jgi:hypothetical protein
VVVQPRVLTLFPLDPANGKPNARGRRVLHPRYGQAALAHWR